MSLIYNLKFPLLRLAIKNAAAPSGSERGEHAGWTLGDESEAMEVLLRSADRAPVAPVPRPEPDPDTNPHS